MQRKKLLFIITALLLMLILTACEDEPEVAAVPTRRIQIVGIPPQTRPGPDHGSYRIFVHLSEGIDMEAGHVAEATSLLVDGRRTIELPFTDPDGTLWSGVGRYNIAITISPQRVSGPGDILVKAAGNRRLFREVLYVDWRSSEDLPFDLTDWPNSPTRFPNQLNTIFNYVVRNGEGIIYTGP